MGPTRQCTNCGEVKLLDDFGKAPGCAQGRRRVCKGCRSISQNVWRAANPARTRATRKAWVTANRDKRQKTNEAWRAANRSKVRSRNNAWKSEHRGECASYCAARRAKKLLATPAWGNSFFIAEAYRLAKLRTTTLGQPYEVDHIVPLRGKLVSGLHVEFNLRVIPRVVNRAKGHHTWPDMP
jgi:hypothetical protein